MFFPLCLVGGSLFFGSPPICWGSLSGFAGSGCFFRCSPLCLVSAILNDLWHLAFFWPFFAAPCVRVFFVFAVLLCLAGAGPLTFFFVSQPCPVVRVPAFRGFSLAFCSAVLSLCSEVPVQLLFSLATGPEFFDVGKTCYSSFNCTHPDTRVSLGMVRRLSRTVMDPCAVSGRISAALIK